MNIHKLKEELIEYAKSIGVDKIGFTTADTFDSLRDRLILQESLGYLSGFEEPDIENGLHRLCFSRKPNQSSPSPLLILPK